MCLMRQWVNSPLCKPYLGVLSILSPHSKLCNAQYIEEFTDKMSFVATSTRHLPR